jgi:formate dehydrogenase major subunit
MSTAYTTYQRAKDLGTPGPDAQAGAKIITLTIDGEQVSVPEGTTVLRAAALNGINIPKLCATDSLEPFGSCRLCLV